MGILYEDVVVISQAEKPGDSIVITVNCPDKTSLGCNLCRIILRFGLSTCRGGILFSSFLWWLVGNITGTDDINRNECWLVKLFFIHWLRMPRNILALLFANMI
ncbi:hypothetical protein Patl1_16021 [Pistacia atlantica]|uniref:Uncharacterized protein n=1 Tax=Pistacia atlantica TaxID=434234 RepID=A0ACC1B811_9ROSI|nr:hypothetical protein Patl1_16021 [Pistacia atlantica]